MQLSKYRKYIIAAVAPVFPVIAHYLNIPPHVAENFVWYGFLVGEAVAFGVYVAPNEMKANT